MHTRGLCVICEGNVKTYRNVCVHVYVYVYIYMYIYICMEYMYMQYTFGVCIDIHTYRALEAHMQM